MARHRKSEELEDDKIDISPLIDCVFILLIFFIVTTKFIDEKGFDVEKPNASQSSENSGESKTLIFTVLENGRIQHEGSIVSLAALESKVAAAISRDQETPVIIEAQKKTSSQPFLLAIDRAKGAGATVTVSRQ